MDWDHISTELRKPLDPQHINPPPPGKKGSYLDGHHVLSEANRIFGEGGWSYSIVRLELVCRFTCELQSRDGGTYEQLRVGYLATVRVEAGGTFKEGAAVGSGMGSPNNEADLHESAVKEAETDALKRALRSYGNPFGLALYDKDKANAQIAAPEKAPKPAPAPAKETPPPFNAKGAADRLVKLAQASKTTQALDEAWKAERETRDRLKAEAPAELKRVVDAFAAAKKAAVNDPARQGPVHDDVHNPAMWQ